MAWNNNAYDTNDPFAETNDTQTQNNNSNPFDAALQATNDNNNNNNNNTNAYNNYDNNATTITVAGGAYGDHNNAYTNGTQQSNNIPDEDPATAKPKSMSSDTTNNNNNINTAGGGGNTDTLAKKDSCLGNVHPLWIVLGIYTLGELLSILAIVIDILDYCEFGSYNLKFHMFESSGKGLQSTNYWESCENDTSDDNQYCSLRWRGVFWLIFIILNWLISLFIIFLLIRKKFYICGGIECYYTKLPILIIISGVFLLFAMITWDVDNTEWPVYVDADGDGTVDNTYTCTMYLFGGSNWCLLFSMIGVFGSVLYGWLGTSRKTFQGFDS